MQQSVQTPNLDYSDNRQLNSINLFDYHLPHVHDQTSLYNNHSYCICKIMVTSITTYNIQQPSQKNNGKFYKHIISNWNQTQHQMCHIEIICIE